MPSIFSLCRKFGRYSLCSFLPVKAAVAKKIRNMNRLIEAEADIGKVALEGLNGPSLQEA